MKRYAVRLKSKTGQPDAETLVFADSEESALEAAVEKMIDKYRRHQNRETDWTAHDVIEA